MDDKKLAETFLSMHDNKLRCIEQHESHSTRSRRVLNDVDSPMFFRHNFGEIFIFTQN